MIPLRAATPDDLPRLAAILGDWNRDTDWMPKLHSREDDLGFLRHLYDRGTIRVAGEPVQAFLARHGGEVDALYVVPEARRQGLGRALMAEAMEAEPHLMLWTFQANTAARAAYAAMGFEEVEFGDGSWNEERLPDVCLEWRRE